MTKEQAYYKFWSSFGVAAYDESTVPTDAEYPRIVYQVKTGEMGDLLYPTAKLFYKSFSWLAADEKIKEIADAIKNAYPPAIKIDDGRMYITKGVPFAQRFKDNDDNIRAYLINIVVEFETYS